ncbi:flagellar hook-length control protein FliK [Rhodanobacter sp. 7MK24]|uniref:flagellar hook-length control protein FliK n=1 Tax=Rhodanobacter sp. 7MK24 TaxID=2775922 RepID=UPI001785C204|nr:flagellar hook-length control protein FliK [Rhodanobacter sp. 7MK24]MBD8881942.1 flagellar hook-length control protein FliK [Rhodanobacter sp. 7MK24]
MNIQPITSVAALTWAGAAAGSAAQSWRIGSVLLARPLGLSPQGLQVVQIGNIAVETDVAGGQLPAQFQVRVLSLGPLPQMEVVGQQSFDPVLQRALRESLPQQNGYAPLLATLDALAERPVLRLLPPDLRGALAMLEQAMHSPAEIASGEGLRMAIERSGVFLESLLANPQSYTAAPMQDDWKAALLRLASVLLDRVDTAPETPNNPGDTQVEYEGAYASTPRTAAAAPDSRSDTPPPLLQRGLQAQPRAELPPALLDDNVQPLLDRLQGDVRGALARIEVAQLESGNGPLPAWMIEIPLQGEHGRDVLQLRLEYTADANDGSRGWNLGFALDLPALGAVQGELQLREPRLSVRLWAAQSDTVQRLERQFTALRHRLAACGLLLDQLSCQLGLPEPPNRYSAVLLQATA